MLVDELGLAIAAQQHREIVEPGNDPLELDALDEEHRHWRLRTAQCVEEQILEGSLLVGHRSILCYWRAVRPRCTGSRCRKRALRKRDMVNLGMHAHGVHCSSPKSAGYRSVARFKAAPKSPMMGCRSSAPPPVRPLPPDRHDKIIRQREP